MSQSRGAISGIDDRDVPHALFAIWPFQFDQSDGPMTKWRHRQMLRARRFRGALLRLVRRRAVVAAVGLLLVVPAAYVEFFSRDVVWWAEGLSVIALATGCALLWTGATGVKPDWIDDY